MLTTAAGDHRASTVSAHTSPGAGSASTIRCAVSCPASCGAAPTANGSPTRYACKSRHKDKTWLKFNGFIHKHAALRQAAFPHSRAHPGALLLACSQDTLLALRSDTIDKVRWEV